MKVIVYLVAVLVATLLTGGAGFLVAVNTPERSAGLIALGVFVSIVFIYGPLTLGSATAHWDVKRSEESKRFFRWWYGVVFALEVLAAVAMVVYAGLAHAPVWLPVLFIAGGAVLTAVAIVVGTSLRRHEENHPRPHEPWAAISRPEIARMITKIVITFVIAFTLVFVTLVLIPPVVKSLTAGGAAMGAVSIAFLAAGVACSFLSLTFSRRVRESVDRDVARLRRLAKVVLRKKKLDLLPGEQVQAARYAAIMSVMLPFQFAALALIYVGIGLQQVQFLTTGRANPFTVFLVVVVPLGLIVLTPLFFRQVRRARRYADEHAGLLATGEIGPAAPSAP